MLSLTIATAPLRGACRGRAELRAATIHVFGLALLLAAPRAHADEGEIYLDVAVSPELAWLAHPAVHGADVSPFDPSGTFTFLPRAGAAARLGVTNELHLGIGIEAAAINNAVARGVTINDFRGDLFAATYFEVGAPLSATWRFDLGSNLTGLVELAAGPMLAGWTSNALGDTTNLDASGLPSRLPVDVPDLWNPGAFARVDVAVEARLFDVVAVAMAPYVGVSWAGTPGVHAGIILRPSIAFSGPT